MLASVAGYNHGILMAVDELRKFLANAY